MLKCCPFLPQGIIMNKPVYTLPENFFLTLSNSKFSNQLFLKYNIFGLCYLYIPKKKIIPQCCPILPLDTMISINKIYTTLDSSEQVSSFLVRMIFENMFFVKCTQFSIILSLISPFEKNEWPYILLNMNSLHPMFLCIKFSQNWPSGLEKKCLQTD